MNITKQLKEIRLGTPLLIKDVAVLLGHKNWSKLCRVESGKQAPSWEVILGYHLIFDIPLIELVPHDSKRLSRKICTAILNYEKQVGSEQHTPEHFSRINCIKKIHERLKN